MEPQLRTSIIVKLDRRQWFVFLALLLINALLAFIALAFGLQGEFLAGQEMPPEVANVPAWVLGLANGGMIVVIYGIAGAIGLWLGWKAGLPGVYRAGAGWRNWLWVPMAFGLIVGVLLVVGDRLFATLGRWSGFAHPGFPMSLIASATGGIGEEILFRGFVMGLWAFLLSLLLRRSGRAAGLWTANAIAALAFAAGHLPTSMVLLNVRSPLELPVVVLAELVVLNSLVALVAGERYMRAGLVAAMGVHFWADIVWHVIWPLVPGQL
jgi:membrane protease YdiL (CAAX protease family)